MGSIVLGFRLLIKKGLVNFNSGDTILMMALLCNIECCVNIKMINFIQGVVE